MELESFFSLSDHLEKVRQGDNTLEIVEELVDFEGLRGLLTERLGYGDKPQGGRPPFDCVAMAKLLLLQHWNNLSDEKTEYMVRDRLSWMKFLGFKLGRATPDENTIRHFRNRLTETETLPLVHEFFKQQLGRNGFRPQGGQIVDGTIVEVPRQRFTKEEKQAIKEGKSAREIWPDKPNKAAQKDVDARWVSRIKGKAGTGSDGKPGQQTVVSKFGFSLGLSVDVDNKLVHGFGVFPANVHDSRILKDIVHFDNEDPRVLGDKAFPSKENEKFLEDNGFTNELMQKKPKDEEMPEEIARSNAKIAKERSRVEHVFGHMKYCRGLTIRTIGLARAQTKLSLSVLAYNIDRFVLLKRRRCTVG